MPRPKLLTADEFQSHPDDARAVSDLAEIRARFRLDEDGRVFAASFGRDTKHPDVRLVLPKSRFGKAVTYLKNQWTALQRYLSDPRLPIDNDQAEQTIRPLTIGRRNWLFLGHPRAAPGRLQLLSIVSSAHRHHLILEEYLSDVLRQLADARQNYPSDLELNSERLRNLLPDRWAEQHPQSIRQARVEEKIDRAEAKRVRRALRRQEQRAAKRPNA